MNASPAGWYPQEDGRQRYWDGQRWTEHFAPGQAPSPTGAPVPMVEGAAPAATAKPARPWFRKKRVLVPAGLLALGEAYRRELVDAMAESAWNLDTDWNAMLELGINDDDAGLLGAGRCAALLG